MRRLDPTSRLALTETLLATPDARTACAATVEWLAARGQHAFCGLVESARNRLVGPGFELSLSEAKHPLVTALRAPAPVAVGKLPPKPALPFRSGVVVPLNGGTGLLVGRGEPTPELVFAARALGLYLQGRPAPSGDPLDDVESARTRFLANMSHELRLPLNSILGYTSMLLDGIAGELKPTQRKHVGRIDSNGQHLLRLINDLLDINRLDAKRMPVNPETFDAAELVREVLADLAPLVTQSGLAVSTRGAGIELHTDRQKVKQILVNLIGNALKFTPKGSVEVHLKRRKGGLALSVRDTGIGIAPENQRTLFEDFRQVDDSASRSYTGAGLGLSISQRLARLLGGDIELESELGKGATFTVCLPLRYEGSST